MLRIVILLKCPIVTQNLKCLVEQMVCQNLAISFTVHNTSKCVKTNNSLFTKCSPNMNLKRMFHNHSCWYWFTRLVPNLEHISEQLEGCFIRKNGGIPSSSLILTRPADTTDHSLFFEEGNSTGNNNLVTKMLKVLSNCSWSNI